MLKEIIHVKILNHAYNLIKIKKEIINNILLINE